MYLDDIFGVWSHNINTFREFIEIADYKQKTPTAFYEASYCPKYTFNGLIKFQLNRFDRICLSEP